MADTGRFLGLARQKPIIMGIMGEIGKIILNEIIQNRKTNTI